MKKMKKVLAILLTLTMVLGMSVMAFAADATNTQGNGDTKTPTVKKENVTGKQGDVGNITVDGLASSDVTVNAYRIIKPLYEGTEGLFSGYTTTFSVEEYPDLAVDFTEENQSIREQIANTDYLNKVIELIHDKSLTAEAAPVISENGTEQDGETKKYMAVFKDLPVGSYVIMITGTEANTYNPVIASIYYDVKDDANVIQQGNINLIEETAWAKRSDSPDVTKKIVEKNERKDSDDAKIGDVIEYQVEINPIPEYEGRYPVLNITDTLGGGLKLKNVGQIKVEVIGSNGNVSESLDENLYTKTATEGAKTLTIDFVTDAGYGLNQLAKNKSYIRITYYAELTTDDAQYNQNANDNEVVLKYTKDSKVDSSDNPDKKKDKTYTYTFDLDIDGEITKKIITKTGDATEEDQKGLAGAEFTLYKSREGAEKNDANDKYINEAIGSGDGKWSNPISSNKDGQLPIRGLAAGTYYLKETKAPDGYSLNTHVYKIEIEAITYDTDGKITSWTIKVDGKANTFTVTYGEPETDSEGNEVIRANVELNNKIVVDGGTMTENYDGDKADTTEIKNTTLSTLPSTGGIGTTIFTIGGCIIMIVAAGLFFASRRKKAEN